MAKYALGWVRYSMPWRHRKIATSCKDISCLTMMLIEIPPKQQVSAIVGFLKGKSAIAIAREFGGKTRNFNGEHFWARGYAVSTVGFEEQVIRKYIEEQEQDEDSKAQGAF